MDEGGLGIRENSLSVLKHPASNSVVLAVCDSGSDVGQVLNVESALSEELVDPDGGARGGKREREERERIFY